MFCLGNTDGGCVSIVALVDQCVVDSLSQLHNYPTTDCMGKGRFASTLAHTIRGGSSTVREREIDC